MQARVIDPRSTAWEVDDPVFRVSFFRPDYDSEEWELTGGDVQDALAWATEHAGAGRTWILHVAGPATQRTGLIRLAGVDPNAAADGSPIT